MSTVAFISSTIAKFIWGTAQDYFGFVKMYGVLIVIQLFVTFSINFLANTEATFCIYIILSFLCEGAHFVVFPSVASALYGPKQGSKVYSLLYISMAIAANIGIIASSFIMPSLGWSATFIFFGILTVFSALLLIMFNEKPLPTEKGEISDSFYSSTRPSIQIDN